MKCRSLGCALLLLILFQFVPAVAQESRSHKGVDLKNAHLLHPHAHKANRKALQTSLKAKPQHKVAKPKWKPVNPNYKAEDSFE